MLLMKLPAEGESDVSERSTCSRTPGANLEAQPAFVEYFVSLIRVRSSITGKYTRAARWVGRRHQVSPRGPSSPASFRQVSLPVSPSTAERTRYQVCHTTVAV